MGSERMGKTRAFQFAGRGGGGGWGDGAGGNRLKRNLGYFPWFIKHRFHRQDIAKRSALPSLLITN